MPEITPWEQLDKLDPTSVRRIARLLAGRDEEGNPLFFAAGIAIAEELKAFCDVKENLQTKKETRKKKIEKKEADKDESQDYSWEVEVLDDFYSVSQQETGTADKDYGRDRRILRASYKHHEDFTPENYKSLINTFFRIRKDEPWIFTNGSFLQFTKQLTRLMDLERDQDNSEALTKNYVPSTLSA